MSIIAKIITIYLASGGFTLMGNILIVMNLKHPLHILIFRWLFYDMHLTAYKPK
jgi:hypothetical protein